jgi:nucleoside-diphosphate-sugar epimerase
MEKKRILVTGSSGFLGAAICADLSRDHAIIGMDCREPSAAQQRQAPDVQWQTMDISDQAGVNAFFDRLVAERRGIDFVLHMAAFYHFGQRWLPDYERVNICGLRCMLEGASRLGIRRFIFAGSLASLPPAPAGGTLNEKTAPGTATAYTRSKTIGESLLAQYSERMPTLALRIAGVVSDWCELPPLYSLMKLWSKPHVMGRMIPGRGTSGFPYIHRRDLVRCVRHILQRHESLAPAETLFASPPGCTSHNELFRVIRGSCGTHLDLEPIFVSPLLARGLLFVKNRVKALLGRKRYERRWMMDYVDAPLVVDTSYTRQQLQWTPGPELSILKRLPVLMQRFQRHRPAWELRNRRRNEGRYAYDGDDGP